VNCPFTNLTIFCRGTPIEKESRRKVSAFFFRKKTNNGSALHFASTMLETFPSLLYGIFSFYRLVFRFHHLSAPVCLFIPAVSYHHRRVISPSHGRVTFFRPILVLVSFPLIMFKQYLVTSILSFTHYFVFIYHTRTSLHIHPIFTAV